MPALRNPFQVAKSVGTAAVISGNRVALGVGIGWCEEEFALLEQDFRTRGRRTDEGLALLEVQGRTCAFIGLERTLMSTVAVFDVTNPYRVTYGGLIVTPGDVSPEGLTAFEHRGKHYLAIAHEVSNTTTVYRIETPRRRSWWW